MCVNGSSARQTEQTDKRPVDMAIVGIVDQVEMDGSVCYKKYPSGQSANADKPEPAPSQEPAPEPEAKAEPAPEPEPEKTPEPKPEPQKPRRVHPEPLILPGPAKPEKASAPEPEPIAAVNENAEQAPNPYHGRQIDLAASEQFRQIVHQSSKQGKQNSNYGKANRR